jgi:Protein-L-isoaspartate(D-aspartate) O-methyltransferase (PCMT)
VTLPEHAGAPDGVASLSQLPPHLLGERSLLEGVSREHSRAVYLGERTLLCRVLGKYLIYADALEIGITPHLALDGYWESWITLALARTVRPGWHCLDVGANHGYYTLVMADAARPDGRVVPIEPTPRLADLRPAAPSTPASGARGKRHHQALIALARRLVDLLHAILRTRRPYHADYARAA